MKKQLTRVFCLLLTAALLLCSGCKPKETSSSGSSNAASGSSQAGSGSSSSSYEGEEIDWENTVVYNGTTYHRRNDLTTVLFLGVDNTQLVEAEEGRVGNAGRADAIILFVLDDTAKTTQVLSVSRNCMTDVDIYTGDDQLVGTARNQINMQYSYGNSPKRCNFLTKRTLSKMLYNTRIDSCISLTMDGISAIVSQLGGITLTMPDDYTEIDPSYTEGTTVTLDGPAAEHFIRYRDITEWGSNEDRVDRQSWFIHEMFRQMKETGSSADWVETMLVTADPYIEMDLNAETIKKLTNYAMVEESLKVPGTNREGGLHDEFIVDEDALQTLILQTFYEPVG